MKKGLCFIYEVIKMDKENSYIKHLRSMHTNAKNRQSIVRSCNKKPEIATRTCRSLLSINMIVKEYQTNRFQAKAKMCKFIQCS